MNKNPASSSSKTVSPDRVTEMELSEFISPTKGPMSFDSMFDDIIDFMDSQSDASYKIIVGSDSQIGNRICFVTAVIIHRQGKGARYFYQRQYHRKLSSLRQKIFYEASLSLHLAGLLAGRLAENGHSSLDVEIHLDVGPRGRTSELIREVVGMVTGSGFDAKIKPDSFGASNVADRHTK